jgi:hypothetical protein
MKMAKKKSSSRPRKTSATRRMRNLTEELTREDFKLGLPLLEAAVAGAVLGFRPNDREMRAQATRCWGILKPQLNQHLLSEGETLLPWARGKAGFPPDVIKRIKERHRELRSLARQLVGVSFADDPDPIVTAAGRALCVLAVKLDDLIDSEEVRLLPALRRMLFA